MTQYKIAFLDEEKAYLEQLQGYLAQKKEIFFRISAYTKAEAFLKALREGASYDAAVMTERFWEELDESPFRGRKILLRETDQKESMMENLSVSKYQPADKLLKEVSAMLWQEEGDFHARVPKAAELIGIYSPARHEAQLLFGVTMARVLGESKKTLYVNLMEHSGFCRLIGKEAPGDIGDLLCGMMKEEYNFAAELCQTRATYQNFDYISPASNPEHLSELSETLFGQLVLALKNRSGYEAVIVDFGRLFLGFAKMLPVFSSFYCLGKEGIANRYRLEEFFDYIKKEDVHAAERMNRLMLPERFLISEDANPIDGSLYGGMGDYIRRCLFGGMEIGR